MEEDEPICSGMRWRPTTHMFHKASHTMGPWGRGTNVQRTEGEQPNGSVTPMMTPTTRLTCFPWGTWTNYTR